MQGGISSVSMLLVLVAVAPSFAGEAEFEERIEVRRVLVDVRVLDREGRPVEGLGPEDFRVRIGGRPARVESVERLGRPVDFDPPIARDLAPRPSPVAGQGRLLVVFFQRDLDPTRAPGSLMMARQMRHFVEGLSPADAVAVVSYWPSFHVHVDFTSDREELLAAVGSVFPFRMPELGEAPRRGLSLRRHLVAEGRGAVRNVDEALLATVRALAEMPGAKSLIYLGSTLGEARGASVAGKGVGGSWRGRRSPFAEALEVMRQERIAFHAMNVTHPAVEYHDFEAVLQAVSRDTGGLYRRAAAFPRRSVELLLAALSAHYELTVVATDLEPGRHRLRVRLENRSAMVLHGESVEIREEAEE